MYKHTFLLVSLYASDNSKLTRKGVKGGRLVREKIVPHTDQSLYSKYTSSLIITYLLSSHNTSPPLSRDVPMVNN